MNGLPPVTPTRAGLLDRIGQLCRGDWSGHVFDGHDVQDWLNTVAHGTLQDQLALAVRLDRIEREYL